MKKGFAAVLMVFSLFFATSAFADSGSILQKMQGIEDSGQDTGSPVYVPDVNTFQPPSDTFPTKGEVQTEIGGNTAAYVNQLLSSPSSSDPVYWYKLGVAYEQQGAYKQAFAALQSAVKLSPEQSQLLQELANVQSVLAPGSTTIWLNGENVPVDVQPRILDGHTLVPVSLIAQKLGADISWDEKSKTAVIRLLDQDIVLVQDAGTATVNNQKVSLDAPVRNIDGRLLIPLRFVGEQLNKSVGYVPASHQTAVITLMDKTGGENQ